MNFTKETRDKLLEFLMEGLRGTDADTPDGDDIEGIIDIFKEDEEFKKLEQFKTHATGLYCIDQDPKIMTKEWIEANSFRLS